MFWILIFRSTCFLDLELTSLKIEQTNTSLSKHKGSFPTATTLTILRMLVKITGIFFLLTSFFV